MSAQHEKVKSVWKIDQFMSKLKSDTKTQLVSEEFGFNGSPIKFCLKLNPKVAKKKYGATKLKLYVSNLTQNERLKFSYNLWLENSSGKIHKIAKDDDACCLRVAQLREFALGIPKFADTDFFTDDDNVGFICCEIGRNTKTFVTKFDASSEPAGSDILIKKYAKSNEWHKNPKFRCNPKSFINKPSKRDKQIPKVQFWNFFLFDNMGDCLIRCTIGKCNYSSPRDRYKDAEKHLKKKHPKEYKEFLKLKNGSKKSKHPVSDLENDNFEEESLESAESEDEILTYAKSDSESLQSKESDLENNKFEAEEFSLPSFLQKRPSSIFQANRLPIRTRSYLRNSVATISKRTFNELPIRDFTPRVKRQRLPKKKFDYEIAQPETDIPHTSVNEQRIGSSIELPVDTNWLSTYNISPHAFNDPRFKNALGLADSNINLEAQVVDQKIALCSKVIGNIKSRLHEASKLTLMAKTAKFDDRHSLSVSANFIIGDKVEVALLAMKRFEVMTPEFVKQAISEVLEKYGFAADKILHLGFEGLDLVNVNASKFGILHQFTSYRTLIGMVYDGIKKADFYTTLINKIIPLIKKSCESTVTKKKLFEMTNLPLTIEFEKISFDVLAVALMKLSGENTVISLDKTQWIQLEKVAILKRLFDDIILKTRTFTIDKVIPSFQKLTVEIERILSEVEREQIKEVIGIVKNRIYNLEKRLFEPIFLQATFLNPSLLSTLSVEQMKISKESVQKEMVQCFNLKSDEFIDLVSDLESEDDIFVARDGMNRSALPMVSNEITIGQLKQLIEEYSDTFSKADFSGFNLSNFWHSNSDKYGPLSEYAIGLLSIPAAVNFLSLQANDLIVDPFAFFNSVEDAVNAERDTIIAFNKESL